MRPTRNFFWLQLAIVLASIGNVERAVPQSEPEPGATAQPTSVPVPTLDSARQAYEEALRKKRDDAERRRLEAEQLKQQQAETARQLKIAAAEREKRRLDEVAAAEREKQRRAAEAAAAKATLVVQSDAECELILDGKPQGKLAPGRVRSLAVTPGEQLVQCVSTTDAKTAVDAMKSVAPGSKQVLKLELAALLKSHGPDLSKAGTVFRDRLKDGGEGPEMVVIPAGSFLMGSPEAKHAALEGPPHKVSVARFAMGRTEVTVAQFRQFVEATGFRTDAEKNSEVTTMLGKEAGCFTIVGSDYTWTAGTSWRKPGFEQSDRHPAVCLSWNDADAFARWLSEQTGERYRLPSESQQEYTIRAGNQNGFAGADAGAACIILTVNVNSRKKATEFANPMVPCDESHVFAVPVGNYQANAFGLLDTVGNAWEWAQDCWNEGYAGAPVDGRAWESGDCGLRVLRGAGWNYKPTGVRATMRLSNPRAHRGDYTGLRLIREL